MTVRSTDLDGTEIDSLTELNIGNDLTTENVRKLLLWKDPLRLTHPRKNGRDNPTVVRVLKSLTALNQFRNGQTTEDDMRRTTDQIFANGIVWKALLLHIAKPHLYPLADVNVLKVWSLHTEGPDNQTWETYEAYCNYFGRIATAIGVARTTQEIPQLKQIDNALFEFGKFLRAYYRPAK